MRSILLKSTAIVVLLGSAAGQPWQNTVNVSMCNWSQFRANIIQDTIYLDGGNLWWQRGLSDGQYATPESDGNVAGLVYTLKLGQPFGPTSNLTALFNSTSKTGGLATNNIAPNYVDGMMFANNDEFILYGGLTSITDSQSPPAANQVLGYEAFQYGPLRTSWEPGFIGKILPPNFTRYVTNGAGVSSPSENLGYYFSGLRAADWGLIQAGDNSTNTTADTLISVDMSVMRNETWANNTLPSYIPGRLNAELAWIPVSEKGVLIAIGGVTNTASLTAAGALTQAEATASNQTSPTFMETVSVYDIASNRWYLQNTTGDFPPQLTYFCSVVGAASDASSFNVYIYGGYDGVDITHTPSDDVYILSVPSFTWIKAYSGQYAHGRYGHQCIEVYPDQMFVLGGLFKGDYTICLDGGIVQVFNLNTLRFQNSYNPLNWTNYTVPSLVTAQIGGNGQGNATKTAPSAWNDQALSTVFKSKYTRPITTFYPYKLLNSTSTSTSSPSTVPILIQDHGGLPAWAGAVIGVVLALILITAGVAFWFFYRRRHLRARQGSTPHSHRSNYRTSIFRWLQGMPPQNATYTHGASELGANDKEGTETVVSETAASQPNSDAQEVDSMVRHELDSRRSERFELPTEYYATLSHRPSQRTNRSISLDGVLHMSVDGTSTARVDDDTTRADVRTRSPIHPEHDDINLASVISDADEVPDRPTEVQSHSHHISDVSDITAITEEYQP